MNLLRISRKSVFLSFLCLAVTFPVSAVHEKRNGFPWNQTLKGYHDQEVVDALGKGWFLNMGPTGVRVQITHENPEYFTVKYVFKKSPAAGLIEIDDIIVGANGHTMDVKHTFGRGKNLGFDGPMEEMSKLIEDSQGKEGKLDLIVWPKGDKSAEKVVSVQIPAVGRFSDTWPFDCPRSDALLKELCEFLIDDYKRAGKFENRAHASGSAMLALMGANDPKYDRFLKPLISSMRSNRYDPTDGVGYKVWNHVHDGIVMGEWYLLKKDKSLEKAMDSLAYSLGAFGWPTSGGFSHRPFVFIQNRMATGGKKGYGAMAMPSSLGMIALSLFKDAGLPYAPIAHNRIHQGILSTVSETGEIGYGFKEWSHAVIEIEDEDGLPGNAKEGIGYEVPEGMHGAGAYKIIWPTKSDHRYRDTGWLKTETETNRVFDKGGKLRLVIRNEAPPEPTKPFKKTDAQIALIGIPGAAALAHSIGNTDDRKGWEYLGNHMAEGVARSGRNFMRGHASTHMTCIWSALGAAVAPEEELRKFLDDIKWWMIMAQTKNGSFVVMPGRDHSGSDMGTSGRVYPTATAGLILGLKEKRLRITGARGAEREDSGKREKN